MTHSTPIQRIELAQDFFRFAYIVGTPISFGLRVDIPPPPAIAVWGKHSITAEDLCIDDANFGFCGTLLQRMAYRLLAIECDAALAAEYQNQDRLNHDDDFVRNSSRVFRLIRNAVAHNIFNPIWKIDRKMGKDVMVIDDVLQFDPRELNGKTLKREHFGGPFALFHLSKRVVEHIKRAAYDASSK